MSSHRQQPGTASDSPEVRQTNPHVSRRTRNAARVRVLLAGVSTRALAESAARSGYLVTALDAFGDLDLNGHARVHVHSLPRDFDVRYSALAAARASRAIECDAVAYAAGFENHPAAVRLLARGRELWGNSPATLKRVRDPELLARALARRGFVTPRTIIGPLRATAGLAGTPAVGRGRAGSATAHQCDGYPGGAGGSRGRESGRARIRDAGNTARWLVKPRASGGGHGVKTWRPGSPMSPGVVLQEYIRGTPGSVVFAAACGTAAPPARRPAADTGVVVLGLSRQLVGERAFGAHRFRYCGSILSRAGDRQFADDEALVARATALARAVTEEFRLVGVNGIDFIARTGIPYPVEVNPRYSASMELVERAYGLSIFDVHAQACAGELPDFDLQAAREDAAALGKAIVYARRTVLVGNTRLWLQDTSVRDVPRPGERIARGRPICTVFARARDARACHSALERRAARVYRTLEGRGRRTA